MTISNLGICFAPTLMRGPDDNAPSIMEIKYSNVVTNTLIEEFDSIFNDPRLKQSQQVNHHANSIQDPQNQRQNHNQTSQSMLHPNQNNHQQPSLQQQVRQLRYHTPAVNDNNLDDHFALGLPTNVQLQQYYQNQQSQQQAPTFNSLQYYPQTEQTSFSSFQYYPVNSSLNSFQCYPMDSNKLPYRSNKVVTLYACVADTESELSFGPNEIITDGK